MQELCYTSIHKFFNIQSIQMEFQVQINPQFKIISNILDFETFGQDALRCPAIDCSIATFYWERFLDEPYTFEELTSGHCERLKVSVEDQVKNYGAVIEKKTVKFWEEQAPCAVLVA